MGSETEDRVDGRLQWQGGELRVGGACGVQEGTGAQSELRSRGK